MPVGPNSTTESWLAIQTRPPVAVTRHIRNVSPEGVVWPHQPRILFVAGDPGTVPFREHRDALVGAIQPFMCPGRDDPMQSVDAAREQFGELLTILVNPTLTDIFRECRATRYTHVHLLSHGDFDDAARDSYGLVLRGPDEESDVVSGERFSSALTTVGDGRIHRPTVITVASCDSGNVGSVVRPGASFAHALHQGGVPLVVASQFPLSIEGSVPLVATLYRGLLWGGNPLLLLQQIRAELHARYTSRWHDWASLVVYEALPQALAEQLDRTRYFQARRAVDAALERIDLSVQPTDESAPDRRPVPLGPALSLAISYLPVDGPFGVECIGLRASARKRLAQAAFALAERGSAGGAGWEQDCCDLLEEARLDYERALRGLLVNDGRTLQRVATLHWIAVQVESLSAVLGKPGDDGRWEAAKLCAEMYAEHRDIEERAWAQGSLAELWLLRLARPDVEGDAERAREIGDRALHHATELARLYPSRQAFPITSTRRQFARYVDWWASPRFERELAAHGLERRARWTFPGGLLDIAARIIEVLQPRSAARGPVAAGFIEHTRKGADRPRRRRNIRRWAFPRPRWPIRYPPCPAREGAAASRASGGRAPFSTSGCCPPGMATASGSSTGTPRRRTDG